MIKANIKVSLVLAPSFEALSTDHFTPLLECMLYIYHPIPFKKDQANVKALLNSGIEKNIITSTYTTRLNFEIQLTNIRAQKIDSSKL